MERSDVLNMLRREVVDVEFVKKDGHVRMLTCTLKADSLPAQVDLEEHVQKKTPNADICAVFDTINQGWRSFRWANVCTINGKAVNLG